MKVMMTSECHLLISTNDIVNIRVENFDVKNSYCEKLLGVKLNRKLIFNSHISDLPKKSSNKVHALARITP